jgi:hypothetical protein
LLAIALYAGNKARSPSTGGLSVAANEDAEYRIAEAGLAEFRRQA